MHLLFRPSGTPNIDDRKCILLSKPLKQRAKFFLSDSEITFFIDDTESIVQSEIILNIEQDEHDELMARQMSLVHRVLLTLSECISDRDYNTYIGKRVNELADRIKQGDKKMYEAIQKNKNLSEHLKDFNRELKNFRIGTVWKENKS